MEKLILSVSPHISGKRTTQSIMLDVIIALIPAAIASVVFFGIRSLLVICVCVATCMLSEFLFEKLCKRENTVLDLSSAVTGMILAFNLPVTIPLWQAIFGSVVAIIVVKQLFGGIGQNFANPAIAARIVMMTAFSGTMTAWVAPNAINKAVDALSTATPLVAESKGETPPSYLTLLLGTHAGCIGETCAAALILGGLYLILRGVISWHTPAAFIAVVAIMSFICGKDALYQVLSGGLLLGAFFMATDYSTTPSTKWGKIIFGIGCGPEGVSFSILLMNILTPYISKLTQNKPLVGEAKV